jgi:hypothetical protein
MRNGQYEQEKALKKGKAGVAEDSEPSMVCLQEVKSTICCGFRVFFEIADSYLKPKIKAAVAEATN